MNWKKFFVDLFKPTAGKIIITLCLGIVSFGVLVLTLAAAVGFADSFTEKFLLFFYYILLPFWDKFNYSWSLLLTTQLLYFYLLSCIIVKAYKSIKKKL